MKRLLKRFLQIVAFAVIVLAIFIWFLGSSLNKSFDQNTLNQFKSEIKKSKALPPNFIDQFNRRYSPKSTILTVANWLIGKKAKCPCIDAASLHWGFVDETSIIQNRYALALKIERQFSQQECLNYIASHCDMLYGNSGVFEASEFYYKKSLRILNVSQTDTMVKMLENPILYNPLRK